MLIEHLLSAQHLSGYRIKRSYAQIWLCYFLAMGLETMHLASLEIWWYPSQKGIIRPNP